MTAVRSTSTPDDYVLKRYLNTDSLINAAPCGLRGCKNGPAPFPGRMSYKATKPGLVFVLFYILACFFIVLVFIRAPFYVLFVFIVCVVCVLVVLVKLSLLD